MPAGFYIIYFKIQASFKWITCHTEIDDLEAARLYYDILAANIYI